MNMKKTNKNKDLKSQDSFFDQNDDFYLILRRGELNKEIFDFWKALNE